MEAISTPTLIALITGTFFIGGMVGLFITWGVHNKTCAAFVPYVPTYQREAEDLLGELLVAWEAPFQDGYTINKEMNELLEKAKHWKETR